MSLQTKGTSSASTRVGLLAGYLAVKLLHGDEVQRLERVSRWSDEVKADVDPGVVVVKQRTLDLQLLLEIVFKLGVDVVDDRLVTAERVKESLCLWVKTKYLYLFSCIGNKNEKK